ncbi:MAG: cation diffusion facilitator family transporter [Cytophagales bacterium]|nr:cation diffusion facilitator family transporter [Cytophagales bacterium]
MHHHHQHGSSGSHRHGGKKNIKVAFFLNFFFTIIEIVGGLMTNSVAILSDALHDLGDTLSLALAWYFQKISIRGRDNTFSYGYKRFSLLGAIINSIILLVGSIFILIEAIPRLIQPQPSDAKGMIILAILGVMFNGAAVIRLKGGASFNEKVVRLHLIEDVMGWVAVLIGAVIMYFFDLPVIDPILSLLISAYILLNVMKNLKHTFQIILQGIPVNADVNAIKSYLAGIPQIEDYHDFHIWSMDGEYNILTVHLVLNESLSMDQLNDLKSAIKENLVRKGVHHATIEFENNQEKCALINC